MPAARRLAHCRAHDYAFLIRRWRSVARAAKLAMEPFAEADHLPIYWLRTRAQSETGLYFSAGIHGDEPGATEGLLIWAQRSVEILRGGSFVIFPCLNPWGLINNNRLDSIHRDLNRTYHDDAVPQTAAHKRLLAGRRFAATIALHEDYDAHGTYIYELKTIRPYWGERLIEASAAFLPIESRRAVEGRPCRNGVIRRKIDPDLMPHHPEAFFLHFHVAARSLTLETPSEFAIDERAAAQAAVLDEVVRLAEAKTFPSLKRLKP